jgi:hypothetical protein
MLLEGPNGNAYIFMSDAWSASNRTNTVVTTLTINDAATESMPTGGVPPMTGTFKPTNSGANDPFPSPAPATTHDAANGATFADAFGSDGAAMNGDWKLYIDDDAGSDPGTLDGGWKITFESDTYTCGPIALPGNGRADFDGDGRTDVSVFRPSEGNWYLNNSMAGFSVINFGLAGDVLVPQDFDGDGKADTAIFRPTDTLGSPDWWILNSNGFTLSGAEWGSPGDIPMAADYDGDGNADVSVWRESDTTWYTLLSGGGSTLTSVGTAGDTPVVGDFDGDGSADMTIFNAGTWTSMLSGGGTEVVTVGAAGDVAVPGDFDGDGQSDQATFRGSTGSWYIWLSSTGSESVVPFGASGDIPAPGDYDGDGKDDVAIYRGGQWWINASTSGLNVTAFGLGSDLPVVASAN